MGTQGTGRRRSTKKERSTAEDDALNLIAREAEARLAAKRAARAEAREIRMKELERQQKELSDDDERMSVGSRGSVRVEDRDYQEKGSRAASALTASTLTSLGGSSSRRGSGETALTVDAESSIREIKEIHELKDQIQDVETKYLQNLKEVKDALAEVEEKYRKAMVSNAQLDNEKSNLMYQVDTLKDSLMELEELLSESRREYQEKVKEYERQKQAHGVLQFQFSEVKETLKQSEELLNEIRQLRLKQEGFVREISDLQETVEWKDKKIGALERQKEYTDAIRVERDELREGVVKLKDILKKHGIVLGPDLNINGDVGEVEVNGTPGAEPASPVAQDAARTPTEGNSMLEEAELRGCREEALDPEQLEEDKDNLSSPETVCSVADESKLETSCRIQLSEGQETSLTSEEETKDLAVDMNVCLLTEADGVSCNHQEVLVCAPGLTETRCGTAGTTGDVITQEEDGKQVESPFRDTKSEPEENESQVPKNEISVSNSEAQHEPENREEAEDDEADGTPSKPPTQAASVKKKKKKRKGKKKGGAPENKSQQTEKENVGSAVEPGLSGSGPETLKTSQSGQVRNGQENQEPTESLRHKESPQEPVMDPVSDELHGDKTSAFEEDEAAGSTGTLTEEKVEKDEDNILKPEKPGSAESAESFNSRVPEEPGMDPVSGELCETRTDAVGSTETLKEARAERAEDVQMKEETLEKTSENVESAELTENSSHPESHQEPITGLVSVSEELDDDVRSEEETLESEEAEKLNQGSSDVGSVKEHITGSETSPEPELDLLGSEDKCGDDVSGSGLIPTESETVDGPETSSEAGWTGPGSGSANISENKEENMSPPHEELAETSSEPVPVPVVSSDSVHPPTEGPKEEAGEVSPCQDAESEQNQDRTENMDLSGDDGRREVQSELNCAPDGEHGGSASLPTQTQTSDTKNGPDGTERTSETETFGPEEVESSSEEPTPLEDPEHQNQEMDSSLCSLAEPEHGSDSQTCEGTNSPQPPLLDGDEEDEEEEGQSFDFDDFDIEAAAEESSQSDDPKKQGAEVTSDDLSETHRNPEEEPADSSGQDKAPDGGNQEENRSSVTQEGGAAEEEGGACEEEEAADPTEEERDLNLKISLSVEEGLDAIQLDSDSPKNTEEAGSNRESPQSGKDSKKSSKKGKGKGKEECKMS